MEKYAEQQDHGPHKVKEDAQHKEKEDVPLDLISFVNGEHGQASEKHAEMQDHWPTKVKEDAQFDLTLLTNGELPCVNCGTTALSCCLECKGNRCSHCCDTLHCKDAGPRHVAFSLVPCGLCVVKPATLQCTFTDKSLCHKCYATDHIKQLPLDGKENQPRRIDYMQQYTRFVQSMCECTQSTGAAESSSSSRPFDREQASSEAGLRPASAALRGPLPPGVMPAPGGRRSRGSRRGSPGPLTWAEAAARSLRA
jgi:hypothetical protein